MTIEYILVLSKDKRLVVYTSLCTCIFYKIQKMICLKNRQDYGTNLQLRSWERGYNSHGINPFRTLYHIIPRHHTIRTGFVKR